MAAWLAPLQTKLRLCLAGPAENLFCERLGSAASSMQSLDQALDGAQVLISGTGWASDLEHRARLLARARGIPIVAVLDHWCNYRERFLWDGEEVLPDQFWVSDVDAAVLAKATFPGFPVQQLRNHWLEGICSAVQAIRNSGNPQQPIHPRKPAKRLLYLLEPIRVSWPSSQGHRSASASDGGEFQALRYFLQQLPQLIEQGWVAAMNDFEALILRPHPSDPPRKYDALIVESNITLPMRLETGPTLAESLAWADAAFGCETQALVAAMACDLPAFSSVPPWAPPCRLPQASLHHLMSRQERA